MREEEESVSQTRPDPDGDRLEDRPPEEHVDLEEASSDSDQEEAMSDSKTGENDSVDDGSIDASKVLAEETDGEQGEIPVAVAVAVNVENEVQRQPNLGPNTDTLTSTLSGPSIATDMAVRTPPVSPAGRKSMNSSRLNTSAASLKQNLNDSFARLNDSSSQLHHELIESKAIQDQPVSSALLSSPSQHSRQKLGSGTPPISPAGRNNLSSGHLNTSASSLKQNLNDSFARLNDSSSQLHHELIESKAIQDQPVSSSLLSSPSQHSRGTLGNSSHRGLNESSSQLHRELIESKDRQDRPVPGMPITPMSSVRDLGGNSVHSQLDPGKSSAHIGLNSSSSHLQREMAGSNNYPGVVVGAADDGGQEESFHDDIAEAVPVSHINAGDTVYQANGTLGQEPESAGATSSPEVPAQPSDSKTSDDAAKGNEGNRRRKWIVGAIILLLLVIIAVAVAVPVSMMQTPQVSPSAAPTPRLRTQAPTTRQGECFQSSTELRDAVDQYLDGTRKDDVVGRYGPIRSWCVKAITNMDQLFSPDRNTATYEFNEPLDMWDMQSVTSMRQMFHNNGKFNQDLSMWKLSSATMMTEMFASCSEFNQDLCPWRDVLLNSSVQTEGMFENTACDIPGTPALFVANEYPQGHFCSMCRTDVQIAPSRCFTTRTLLTNAVDGYLENRSPDSATNLLYGFPMNNWCVSGVTNMDQIFSYARNEKVTTFNEPLDKWDVSSVESMYAMFFNASSFNSPLGSWNVEKVTSLSNTFRDASSFNQDLRGWNVSRVTSLTSLFSGATVFNGDISSWDTSGVNDLDFTFSRSGFNRDLTSWNTGKVSSMQGTFLRSQFSRDLNQWNTRSLRDLASTFSGAAFFDSDLRNWDVSRVTTMAGCFSDASSFGKILGDVSTWNVSNVEKFQFMFSDALSFDGDLSNWDMRSARNLTAMFQQSESFTGKGLSNWRTSNVVDLSYAFFNTSFNQDLNSWDTSSVTTMVRYMFIRNL